MAEIKLKKRYKYVGDIFQKLIDIGFDIETATAFLNNIKDADVVEVKHGYWIKRTTYPMGYNCSECNNSETYKSPFCRLCGTKMDGTPKERGGEK